MKNLRLGQQLLLSTLLAQSAFTSAAPAETVVVTASRVETPLREVGASISVVTAEEIELKGYATLSELLKIMPGINISNSGGIGKTSALRIRGEENYRTKIIIDGIDISDPTGTQAQPQIEHILTSEIEQIEILRGPQGMMYGADSGGIINIITKQPKEGETQAKISAELGRYDTSRLSGNIRAKEGKFSYSLSATQQKTDGFSARSDDISNEDDGYENQTINVSLGYDVNEHLSIRWISRDVDADNEYDGCFVPSENCTSDFEQTNNKLNAKWAKDTLTHELSFGKADVERSFYSDGFFSFGTEGEITEAQYLGSFKQSDSHRFVYGIDWKEEDIDNSGNPLDRSQTGIYAEWQQSHADKLFFTVGLRHDDHEDYGTFNSHRVTAAYIMPSENEGELKFKASFGDGFRTPSFNEVSFNNVGNALKEETTEGFDIGFEYKLGSLKLEMIYFDQEVQDEIIWDRSVGFSDYEQLTGTSESTGLETIIDYNLSKNVFISFNYTSNSTEDGNNNQRVRRPQNSANLSIGYQSDDGKLNITSNYNVVRNQVDISQDLEDYEVMDISAKYQLNKNIDVFARIENAFDEDYQTSIPFNSAGKAFYGGVRYRF